MKLYVMRHGQTEWNVLKKIQGHTDIELNETGISQAQKAKDKFNEFSIDLIISSPLKRASKTAEIINEDKKVPIIIEEKIIERGFGDIEGACPDTDELFLNNNFWDYKANLTYGKVEPVADCCNKIWNFLDEVKSKYNDKNVLLVTHGGTARVIQAYFIGIKEDGMVPDIKFPNCEIREYDM